MVPHPVQQYQSLMATIRGRLDLVAALQSSPTDPFSKAETAAFHGRKIVEGIAFSCLVALENGLKHVPRDARGKWNAADILDSLQSKDIKVFPSPSAIRAPTGQERTENSVSAVVEGLPENRLSHDELKSIYARLHKWLHEINPYVQDDRSAFLQQHAQTLWDDLARVHRFVERHFISIGGRGFFCTLRDSHDGITKVLPLERVAVSPSS
jgi:hypothetical protein